MRAPRKSRTGRQNVPRRSDRLTLRDLPFAQLVRSHPDLIKARCHYAAKAPAKRRAAAKWEYHDAMAAELFSAALGQVAPEDPTEPRLDAGILALAIDPRFAPALLTVGSLEYQLGRVDAAMELFLGLATLPADEPDLEEVIDQAGDFLLDRNDFDNALKLYEAAVNHHAETAAFWSGAGYCLGRLGRKTEAVAAARRAVAIEPSSGIRLNDLGWALLEAESYTEARSVLERAVALAPADYDLPRANLVQLEERLKQRHGSRKRRT
jgi:tetratricopeptide (TPR) repeat protein